MTFIKPKFFRIERIDFILTETNNQVTRLWFIIHHKFRHLQIATTIYNIRVMSVFCSFK